jgi:hypothetical protein
MLTYVSILKDVTRKGAQGKHSKPTETIGKIAVLLNRLCMFTSGSGEPPSFQWVLNTFLSYFFGLRTVHVNLMKLSLSLDCLCCRILVHNFILFVTNGFLSDIDTTHLYF